MKYFLIIAAIFSIFSFSALAGGGGGTVLPGTMIAWDSGEVVRHLGEYEGSVYFQYGEKIGDEWVIDDFIVPKNELKADPPAFNAIENSREWGGWQEIIGY